MVVQQCGGSILISFLRIGYVELRSLDLVSKAIALTGTIVMGLPIKVQLTEAERNRVHSGEWVTLVYPYLQQNLTES